MACQLLRKGGHNEPKKDSKVNTVNSIDDKIYGVIYSTVSISRESNQEPTG